MNSKKFSKLSLAFLLSSLPLFAVEASKGAKVLETKCIACHTGNLNDGLSRISDQRKTPEGWYMTVSRMQRLHGLSLIKEEEQNVIKYLADNQGLTPSEIKPFEYIVDKKPNIQEESKDNLISDMCVRCHSYGRVGLQRRTSAEWDRLINFHVGQFISFEIQAEARDRDWFTIAQEQLVPYLEKVYGMDETKWLDYKKSIKNYIMPSSWIFYGHSPKDGDFTATLTLKKANKKDTYIALYKEKFLTKTFEAEGKAILYSGSELRVSLKDKNNKKFQQILHINPKESSIKGRIFETLHSELGSSLTGMAIESKQLHVSGIYPSTLKVNEKTKLTILGSNLSSKVELSDNVKVLKVVSSSKNKLELEILANNISNMKKIDIKIADKLFKDSLVVYDKVDYLKVTPDYAIARYGSENEKIQKEYAQFEAIGFLLGPDGKKDTQDDIKLSKLPVLWNMKPYDEQAIKDKDVMYAGTINRYTGLFTPSEGGPNTSRKLMANNVGNLTITATYIQGKEKLQADSHLIVTVPKFVNPPIN